MEVETGWSKPPRAALLMDEELDEASELGPTAVAPQPELTIEG